MSRSDGDRVARALDALGARQGRAQYGDAVVSAALRNLITDGQDAPDIATDVHGAAAYGRRVAENEAAMLVGLLDVADLLLTLRQRETGDTPSQTLALLRAAHDASTAG